MTVWARNCVPGAGHGHGWSGMGAGMGSAAAFNVHGNGEKMEENAGLDGSSRQRQWKTVQHGHGEKKRRGLRR